MNNGVNIIKIYLNNITKSFIPEELLARTKTHINLNKMKEEVATLRGIIPICASCKKIRNDTGYWEIVEKYISEHTEVELSHGIYPECYEKFYGDLEK